MSDIAREGCWDLIRLENGAKGDDMDGDGGVESLGEENGISDCGVEGYEGAAPGRSISKVDNRLSGGSGEEAARPYVLIGSTLTGGRFRLCVKVGLDLPRCP